MQIGRLFEIVYMLMEKSVTAKELAAHFEVSVRTVYRDIETLCQSGIPIYMTRGRGGGIRLLDNYVLDRSVLSKKEQNEIISALQSLKVTNNPDVESVLKKLSALFGVNGCSWITVDFSNWSHMQKDTFDLIKRAVIEKRVICFYYYNSACEKTYRIAEPLQLWFKDKAWYIRAFCRKKRDVRVFKLTRIKDLKVSDEIFKRNLPDEPVLVPQSTPAQRFIKLKLIIDASQAYRVYDEFEESEIVKKDDNSFVVTVTYPQGDWVYGYILSFGETAQVVEPQYAREHIKKKLQYTMDQYS